MRREGRLDYIDGLRGIAVLMVVLVHSAGYDFQTVRGHMSTARVVFTHIAIQGGQGVSLFLVLSGFCLSLPVYRRHAAGRDDWFSVRHFAARRCWRILPPYYAALAMSIVLTAIMGNFPSLLDVAAHVLLIHNVTPYVESINGPFWSLALEWQWYTAFPFVLYGMLHWPRITLAGCFALACVWHLVTHDAGFIFLAGVSGVLPARLFEFASGTAVARLAASDWQPPKRFGTLLGWAIILPVFLMSMPPIYRLLGPVLGPPQPLAGISFGAIVMLAIHVDWVRRLFSWRPLVRLGLVSYSVYLIHEPVILLVQPWFWSVLHQWQAVTMLNMGVGITAGVLFFRAVEAHFVDYPAGLITWSRQLRPARSMDVIAASGQPLD